MGKNKKGKKKKNRGKNKHNGKMSSQKETHGTDRGRKRRLSFEEVAPKRQKCTADKQQFHEGNVGQASNTETSQGSHMHIPPEGILNENQRPSERQYPFQVKGNIQQYPTNVHNVGIGVHGTFPLLEFWFSTCRNMNGDINHALWQTSKLTLDAQQFDTLLQWVINCTNLDHLYPMQGLYLCYVLGHLMPPYGLQIPQSEQVKHAFDKLLGCLAECAKYDCFNMSFSFCQPLEQLSRILVDNCSYPGWLTLVVYFYPYYRDKKRLLQLQMAHLNYVYELNHYNYLLSLLLPNIEKVNGKSHSTLRELLKMVLQSAPEGHDLFRLCEDKNMKRCFFNEEERLKFFANCYLERLQSNGNNSTIGEVLKKLLVIPARIRDLKWRSLYEYLRRFAKSDGHLTDEDIADFQQLTLHLPKEESHDILMFLSESSSPRRQNMVLEFLKSPKFESKWKSVPLKKVAIGKSWLIRKLETAVDDKNHMIAGNMVLTAHCLFKDFISCLPVRENKTMFSELGKTVRNWLLENVDNALIIKESGEISNDDLPSDVRSNLFKLVDEVLRQNFNLVNTKETMNNFYNSSFRSQLFNRVLDSLEIPNYEKKQHLPTENIFLPMLQYCEIWIALFRTERDFERVLKFRNGKRIWQNLASCLEKEEISVEFLSHVAKYENELSLLLAYAVQRTPQENIDSRQQHNLTMIKNLVEKEKVVREKLSCLESAIKFAKAINSVQFPQILNEKREHLKTKILKELNDDFWGPLLPLLELSSKLEPVMDSVSFRNIAEDCVKNISTYSSDDDDTKALYLLFTLLTTEAIQQFKEKWKKLSDDPESQTFETMKILEGIRDEEDLKKELSILEKNLSPQLIPDNLRQYMLDYVKYESVQKDVCVTFKALDTFKLRKPNNNLVATLTKFEEEFKPDSSICLQQLHGPMAHVQGIIGEYLNENDYDVIDVLGQSGELIEFLKEIIHVDIRILIDAVEEHSDQFVSESLVSELIHVHGFLAPVIEVCQNSASGDQLPQHVLQEIKNQCKDNENMAVKIHQCNAHVHSLQQLYHSVANRGEVTREIITHCLTKGYACISLEEEGVCKIEIKYKKKDESEASYILSDLRDLRSRAHLIVSPDRSWKHSSENDESMEQRVNFVDFIDQVNILCDIEELILKLRSSGYIKYQTMNKVTLTGVEELQEKKKELQDELCDWEKSLDDARRQHHFLNYYWSDQLCVLYNFLTNRNRSEVDFENLLTLIHFVDSNIEEQYLRDYGEKQSENHSKNQQNNSECNPDEIILIIGNALDEIFAKTRPTERAILKDQTSCFEHQQNSEVQPGELYVVALKKNSTAPTINVVLSLYENTLNTYPELNQIIFCDADKQWREIKLFLRRCFARNKPFENKTLFCLANVELLENEVQFNLIEFIKAERKNNPNYLLAIICRGGDDHHIIEEFSQFSHRIPGMSNPEISQRFRSSWPDVKFVTSTLPGLGKTEFIREEALEKGMNVVTFPISGQFDQSKIIQRLNQLDLKDFQCLHFDIGEVDDPILLDTFLFQLIVTGMVSCGTQLYSLRNTHVYIEVANSLNDRLCESLVISQSFTCKELKWDDYKNLKVSKKTTSDIQVVCQYLDVFDRNRLESTDVRFKGQQRVESLPANRCHELLRKYYLTSSETTFTALNTFLGLLANQLRNFSKSSFFMTHNIKYMVEQKQKGVRRNLFEALLEVSKNFAARALNTCSSRYHLLEADTQSNTIAEHMIGRVEEMIHWEQNNHLLIVFHGNNSQAITAFYRKKEDVPPKVSDLLKNQIVKEANKELEDFELMNQQQLQEKLEKIVRTESRGAEEGSSLENESSGYALTPDNMLKMILIILRMRANVPIIIMGETGCGKTSLIKYLANICEIPFFAFNIHAGRSEEEIKEFVKERDKAANENPNQNIWVFLDEINTCGHLGLINGILCHHLMGGQPLATNLVFIAACNPYKRRTEDHILTAGLEMNNMKDEYSKLVYRVHPLPEAMVDYVWDYGSLTPHDEKEYIKRMIQSLPGKYLDVLAELIAESQRFIRESEDNPYCVSLRDVRRYVLLVEWFINMIEDRGRFSRRDGDRYQEHLRKYRDVAQQFDTEPVLKSIILALAHCYLSRLETDELRRRYQERVTQVFATMANVSVEEFSAIIRMEQEDYLDRMELPSGTARNAALRENVFVMLVSILNRIPVFVVGKPGCSKSLAIQLIRSSLRGKDSRDPFFKTLPQLYVVSYQGSESSTSEGITKIFEKASNYKKHNKDSNVLPVVLLDEVGLAENSPNNPLKVLHSILEPGKGELPEVAVVGISNWALDAAKMNRAIHLSRPEPTVKDLEETAISLYQAQRNSTEKMNTSSSSVMNCLAKSYHEYLSQQGHANFHGLRDYYSLIKSLGPNSCDDMDKIHLALHRNFGGIPAESSKVQQIFVDKIKFHVPTSREYVRIPVTALIQANLDDLKARHLMLITNGDSAIGILKQNLSQSAKETITIFGSRFEEDMSDDYNYRMLSRIILYMERDCILILRDLECIYGSLYDMLNQNYSVVGKRKNCRVALGANSNPMCYVNDGFRCIVLVDHDKVDYSDPPFLNRFEKQLLRFSDVLNEDQQEIIEELESWVEQMSCVEDLDEQFKKSDMFMGFHEDTLPSLVLLHSNDTDESNEEIVKKCKDDLMWIATPDGVLRTQKCERVKEDPREVNMLTKEYFEKPLHNGLASFIAHVVEDEEFSYLTGGDVGSKTIVMTYATVHTDIAKCLGDTTMKYQLERLGAYSAQKQLEDRVENFFSSDKELLVFQCKPEHDGEHMLLARSIIEEKRRSYEKSYQNSHLAKQKKHICILVHLRRGTTGLSATWWQFNYLCSWKQAFLDVIEQPLVAMNEIRTESIEKLLTESSWSFKKFSSDSKCLLWCFNCIKYIKEQRPLDIILKMAKDLFESKQVFNAVQSIVIRYVNEQENYESVAVKVACTKEILINSSTFSSAIEHYLCRLVRNPLAKIIYFLERENAWPTRISDEKAPAEYNDVWCDLISRDTIFDIFKIPDPLGTESYIIDGVRLELSVPFSQVIVRKVNAAKEQVLEAYDLYTDEDEEHNLESQDKQMKHYIDIVTNIAPDILDLPGWCLNSYLEDFIDITLASFSDNMKRRERVQIGNKALSSFANDYGLSTENPLYSCIQSHLLMWNFKHQIIDQIRMINLCKPFVEETVVENVIKQFVEKSQREVNSRPIETGSVSPNLTRDDEAISIERTDMETNVECERSENVTPNLKRKNEQSQYLEHLDQEKMAKRRKHGMETEFKMTESESSILKNSADKPDDSETDAKGTEYRESESESSDNESSNEESNSSTSESEHDGSEDVHTSNADLETSSMSECFEDVLVTKFCEEMFPSEVLINRDGLESWIRNSSLLLSLAFNVSNQAPAFHFLRLCVDYAKMVQKTGIPTDYLYKLDEIAKELKPEYLDKDGSLQNLKKKLVDPLTSELDPAEERYVLMQKFLAKFHNRFLDTYKDAQSAIPIFENVFSLDREDLVLLMKPVMYSLFYACQTKSSGIFFDMIIDQSVMDNCPILNAIDKIFKECFSKGFIHHDSYPAVLICDVVVSILEFDERCNIQTLTTPECELLKCLRCATNVLNGGENYVGLVLLTSVAFLRVFYTKLSRHIYERKKDISFEEEFIIMEKPTIMEEINSLLALNNARSSSLQIFFLKQLYKTGMTLFDLHQFFSEGETFPAVTSQIKQCKVVHKAELVSVQRLQEYREVEAAYVQLEQRNKSDMLNMLLKCRNSAKNRLAVMGFLINTFYIKKAVTNLSHKEEQLAHWFSVVIEEYPVMKQLLLRIIGREKFSHPGLQISPESSAHDIETALLILHITCVVASRVNGEMSPLFQYLIKPKECHNTWLLVDKKRKQRVFDEFAFYNASRPITCSCHMRIKFKENGMQNICPYCGTETSTQANSSEQAKIYNLETKSKEWEECTANMSASVYRALDMIVYACFYAGIATGISSSEDVFPLLPTNEQGSTLASTCKDSADFCFNRVKDDLRCLQTILSCDSRTAVDVMHLVVEECTELIRGKTPGDGIFLTEQQRAVWEKKFATTAKDVLSNALRSSRLKFDESNEQRVLIQELDKYPSDHQKHDRELKRLFRLTKKPSFNELRSTFIDSSREFQEQHKVLALLFSQFDELPHLAHLFPLLRWSRLISSMLTHRISRKEAELKTVDDLIHGRIPGHEKVENEEALKKYLDEFLIAWEGMRDFVDQELPNGTDPMPSLTQHSCFLGYCLTEGDFSIYLQTAIKILQSIQNNILDEMILISTRIRHPALHFLELDENCCAIMSVALQEVKKKDIINFNWPDEFLIFTHKLEYGQGEKIDYDFERIELELANEIAFGKSYLTESPNTFIFSKELFHSSAKMLTKIRELCPKTEPLPEEICLGLHSLKERRIQDAQNLLQHIEGVIFVLNTQSILIQDMKLIEFADKWKSKLPSEFPVHLLPDPIIKLAHIPALYEALEDILVDGTIKGLPRKFRAELTEETKKSLNSLVDHRNGSLKLKLFLTALRRFVFRYLSAEKFLPESHTPLRSCLMEPSLWSPEEAPSPDVIPEKMALGDIYAIITHLEPKSKYYSSVSAGRSRFSKKQKRPGRIVSRS